MSTRTYRAVIERDPDRVAAVREAADAGFDVLVACAFNFEAHATEFGKLGLLAW